MNEDHKNISIEWIEKVLKDESHNVRRAAVESFKGRSDIPLEWIEKALKDEDCYVRLVAIEAFKSRSDIPLEWIERTLAIFNSVLDHILNSYAQKEET